MIVHQQQPLGSKLCGPTCVAMIVGRPLSDVMYLVARRGTRRLSTGTTEPTLRALLRECGWALTPFVPCRRGSVRLEAVPPPKLARLRTVGRTLGYHWVVVENDIVYDPGVAAPMKGLEYADWCIRTARYFTSEAAALRVPAARAS